MEQYLQYFQLHLKQYQYKYYLLQYVNSKLLVLKDDKSIYRYWYYLKLFHYKKNQNYLSDFDNCVFVDILWPCSKLNVALFNKKLSI